jgi:hypothetical protein
MPSAEEAEQSPGTRHRAGNFGIRGAETRLTPRKLSGRCEEAEASLKRGGELSSRSKNRKGRAGTQRLREPEINATPLYPLRCSYIACALLGIPHFSILTHNQRRGSDSKALRMAEDFVCIRTKLYLNE